jgi:hypothetical protein
MDKQTLQNIAADIGAGFALQFDINEAGELVGISKEELQRVAAEIGGLYYIPVSYDTETGEITIVQNGGGGGITLPIDIADVTGLQDELNTIPALPIAVSDVTNLQTELDGKFPETFALHDGGGAPLADVVLTPTSPRIQHFRNFTGTAKVLLADTTTMSNGKAFYISCGDVNDPYADIVQMKDYADTATYGFLSADESAKAEVNNSDGFDYKVSIQRKVNYKSVATDAENAFDVAWTNRFVNFTGTDNQLARMPDDYSFAYHEENTQPFYLRNSSSGIITFKSNDEVITYGMANPGETFVIHPTTTPGVFEVLIDAKTLQEAKAYTESYTSYDGAGGALADIVLDEFSTRQHYIRNFTGTAKVLMPNGLANGKPFEIFCADPVASDGYVDIKDTSDTYTLARLGHADSCLFVTSDYGALGFNIIPNKYVRPKTIETNNAVPYDAAWADKQVVTYTGTDNQLIRLPDIYNYSHRVESKFPFMFVNDSSGILTIKSLDEVTTYGTANPGETFVIYSLFDNNWLTFVDAKTLQAAKSYVDSVVTNRLLQRQVSSSGTYATGNTLVPSDNTIHQITEGTQFLSLSFTKLSQTSVLHITALVNISADADCQLAASIFQTGTSDALATGRVGVRTSSAYSADQIEVRKFNYAPAAGSYTFTVRAGTDLAANTYFNGVGGSQDYGGALSSYILVEEYEIE